jgi:uncharacterized damage-inducible protein DinB
MLTETLKTLFDRDLSKLRDELTQYQQESRIWHIEKSIANSAGNLCLHLVGNLNTYIGATLGYTDYIRNRDREFSATGIPRAELLRAIEDTRVVVAQALSNLPAADLTAEYPMLVLKEKTSTEYFLVHLATHLAYHLGQVNYHRRLLDSPLAGEAGIS